MSVAESDRLRVLVRDLKANGTAVDGLVTAIDIAMSPGEHDEASLFVASPTALGYNTTHRSLLSFSWGTEHLGRFHGYVTDVTPQQRGDKKEVTYKITAQGPTFVMKSGRPRFFTEMTAAQVIQQIAAEYQLGFSDEYGRDHYVWRQLAQTGESDWSFINTLCARIGAVLVCTDGVLRLLDPMSVLCRSTPLEFASRHEDGQPNIFDFTPTHFSDRLPSQIPPSVAYLSNGQVIVQKPPGISKPTTTTSTGQSFCTSRPVLTQEEAKLAQIRLPVDWEEQATVTLQHAVRVQPGSIIALRTGYAAAKLLKYDGFWYVTGVLHRLTTGAFMSSVDLARVTHAPRLPGTPARQWHMDPRGRPQLVPGKNGNWMSTRR